MKHRFTLMLCVAVLLATAVSFFVVSGQQQELTPDEKHELEMFRKMGGVGEPTSFRKRFVKAERPGLPDTWIITFTYEVTDRNLEKTAKEIAKQFGLKIKRGGLIKGEYARMAIVTGPEEAMERLSRHRLVRRVGQDSQGVGSYGPFHQPATPRPEPQLKPRPKPLTPLSEEDDDIAINKHLSSTESLLAEPGQ